MSPLRSSVLAGLSVLTLLGSSARAEEKLLVVNSTAKGSVELVVVGSGERTPINTDRLRFPKGAVLELGGDLIVTTQNDIRRYVGAMAGQPSAGVRISNALQHPDGPSLDPGTGDLFVVGRSRRHHGLFRLRRDPAAPGGFRAPEPVGGSPLSTAHLVLADTKVVDAAGEEIAPGDVLVLARRPAALFRFVRSGDGFEPAPRLFTRDFPANARPTGMTFSVGPSGCEILVSDARGTIHRFDSSGRALASFNEPGAHPGLGQVSASLASGQAVLYASLREGRVLKFAIGPDGTAGDAAGEAIPATFHRPDGLGAVAAMPTLAGSHVTVRPAFGLDLRFDQVSEAGFTSAELGFVDQPILLGGGEGGAIVLPSGNVIPEGVVAPVGGDPRIPLLRIDTTAVFNGTFRLHGNERALLDEGGGLPELHADESLAQPSELVRWMFAPEIHHGEPPIAECGSQGCQFTDITSGLGSHVGRGWDFSEYLMVRDTRGDNEDQELTRIRIKVSFLRLTLESERYAELPAGLRAELSGLVDDYAAAMNVNSTAATGTPNPASASQILDQFAQAVLEARLPNSAPDNFEGELLARARTLKFSTCTFLVSDPAEINGCVGEN
jgi:hypothetical protein